MLYEEKLKTRLRRVNQRIMKYEDMLKDMSNMDLTMHGYWDKGYLQGKITTLELELEFLEELLDSGKITTGDILIDG